MTDPLIDFQVSERVGTITLKSPDTYNTFRPEMVRSFNEALEKLGADPEVRCIVIRAEGKAFSAGIDLKDAEGLSAVELKEWVRLMESPFPLMRKILKPIVCSVQGAAVANGIGLVAAADLAVASDRAVFGATAVKVGLFCMGPAVLLKEAVGRKKALELLMTGDTIDGEEAKRIGLVNEVVPHAELEEATDNLVARLIDKNPEALALGKESFYSIVDLPFERALEATNDHFALLLDTDSAKAGIEAFLQKKPSPWK